jgi:hypothetical protein
VWQFMPAGLKKEPHIQLETWEEEKEKILPGSDLEDWKYSRDCAK